MPVDLRRRHAREVRERARLRVARSRTVLSMTDSSSAALDSVSIHVAARAESESISALRASSPVAVPLRFRASMSFLPLSREYLKTRLPGVSRSGYYAWLDSGPRRPVDVH